MNYLSQLQAFRDYQLFQTELSSGQISLYYALMQINNKCSWIEWFTAANSTLETLSGLSRSGINKSRNVLKQLGLIDFRSNGKKATSYKVCVLYTSNSTQGSTQQSVQDSTHSSTQQGTQGSVQRSTTLVKHKHKQNINETSSSNTDDDRRKSLFELYQREIGMTSGLVGQQINYAIDDFVHEGTKESEAIEIIKLAITRAVENNARSWSYINAIIDDWQKHSLFKLSDIKAEQKKHTSKRSGGRRVEVATDWDQAKPDDDSLTDDEKKAETARLQEKLRKMRARRNNEEATS